jgi:deoxyribodipyrimidine photolyase-related protein
MITLLLLPNQLFNPDIIKDIEFNNIVLYEHPKFFTEFNYHKSKLVFHRASMQNYYDTLQKKYKIKYLEYYEKLNINNDIIMFNPVDFDISNEITRYTKKHKVNLEVLDSPLFIFTESELDEYINSNKSQHYFNAPFYKWARIKKNILMNKNNPLGGKWSFDIENRLRFPKTYKEKPVQFLNNQYIKEATKYVEKNFADNYGEINIFTPINHTDAEKYLQTFLNSRLKDFGAYEDAISSEVMIGYHSGISALLNIGLLDPLDVIEKAVKKKSVKIQSIEGFVRQILSWREYVRLLYIKEHNTFIKKNFFKHTNKLPKSWYTGTTGIVPLDNVIKKALKIAYAHHIERLMIAGNLALLMQLKPTDVYKWFIEILAIDAYEWVMEPNVYGMSQHSVGQLMMNRPYFSSSNYIFKMSNYKKNDKNDQNEKIILDDEEYEWYEIFDALYYNFINDNKTYLKSIYATANSVFILNKKSTTEKTKLFKIAKLYLS